MPRTPFTNECLLNPAQKHAAAIINEFLIQFEHSDRYFIVIDQVGSLPSSPTLEDTYLLTSNDTTESGYAYLAGQIAFYVGQFAGLEHWLAFIPKEGDEAYDQDTGTLLRYDGSIWS